MPAKKKPVGQHKLQGTYQKCRHQERAEKATTTGEREVPDWLPAKAKPVYAELMQELPPLSSNDAITLAQVAILKAELMESPEDFKPQKHTQLRHLCATVKGWIDDYQSVQPVEAEDNPWKELLKPLPKPGEVSDEDEWKARGKPCTYEEFQAKRAAYRAEQEAMTQEERAEKHRQTIAKLMDKPVPPPPLPPSNS